MTIRSRIALAISTAVVASGLALAPAFDQDKMSNDAMKKDSMSKDGMAKDGMKK